MNGTEFVGLYDVQYPRIFRYLLWRLRQRDAAEEVTAEVFAIALRTFQQGPAPARAGGWLVDVADHLASQERSELLDGIKLEILLRVLEGSEALPEQMEVTPELTALRDTARRLRAASQSAALPAGHQVVRRVLQVAARNSEQQAAPTRG